MTLDLAIKLGYLIGAIAFIWGLRLLSSPDTARKGNMVPAGAISTTLSSRFGAWMAY